jgi:hypothetical protein
MTMVVNMRMTKDTNKGYVGFNEPYVKLVVDLPADEEIREHLDDMKANDGYEGSCGISGNQEKE